MTEQDLKLVKLRNSVIKSLFEEWGIVYDVKVLTDLCLLTENIVYKNIDKDYQELEDIFFDDLVDANEENCVDDGFEDTTDLYAVLKDLWEDILNDYIAENNK